MRLLAFNLIVTESFRNPRLRVTTGIEFAGRALGRWIFLLGATARAVLFLEWRR